MKLFAFKCKKVLTFGLGSVIIGTVKKRQSEYTYEKGLFPWLYIRGVSTEEKTSNFLGVFSFLSCFLAKNGLFLCQMGEFDLKTPLKHKNIQVSNRKVLQC